MANFINIYSSITAYNADETKEYPNVSYLETEDEVKWQATEPIDQEYVVAKYNVVDTSNPTRLLYNTINITKMYIDGVEQPSATGYTFSSTGTHKVKYKVKSNWSGQQSFQDCSGLTSITIPDSVTNFSTLSYQVFQNCSNLTTAYIGSGVTIIASSTFYGCSSLTSVTIGSGVTFIGGSSFLGCSSLSSITIPDSVTRISSQAFNGCSGLTSVVIPSGVTRIEERTFNNCYSLSSVTVEATTPPTLDNTNAFSGNASGRKIYVPSASVNAYKTANNWSTYANDIEAIPS